MTPETRKQHSNTFLHQNLDQLKCKETRSNALAVPDEVHNLSKT